MTRSALNLVLVRRVIWIALLAGILATIHGYIVGPDGSTLEMDTYGVTYARAQTLENAIWVDARTESQFAENHLPGAIHLTEDNWDNGLSDLLLQWGPDFPVIVYCDGNTCGTSRTVARRLREDLQTDSVYWLIAGWDGLQDEGKVR